MKRVALLLVLLLQAAVPRAQDTGLPPVRAERVAIAGVVRAASGEPLRGARVTVTADGGRAAGRTFADQNGRFEAVIAADGVYTIDADKAGYAPRRLTIDAAGIADPLEMHLERGGVLRGRATDTAGDPVVDATVDARRVDGSSDAGVKTALTDDLGEYRLGSLPAGRYAVRLSGGGASNFIIESFSGPSASGNVSGSVTIAIDRFDTTASPGSGGSPSQASGGTPGLEVDVQSGRETVQDLVREGDPLSTPRSWAGVQAGSEAARRASGAGSPGNVREGLIAGRVLGPTMRPIPSAIVRLIPGDGGTALTATSDQDGRYAFDRVPDGRYRISASASSMMEAEYGAGFGSPGRWVEVREGERLQDLDVVLPRGAVIGGRVLDDYGEPIEGITVHIWQSETRDGRTVLQPIGHVRPRTTDDRGSYRLHGVMPGTYLVVASDAAGQSLSPATRAWTFAPVERISQGARLVVRSFASASAQPNAAVSYYPGRPSVSEASPVTVDAGVDAFGVDMVFAPPVTARVTGSVVDSEGQPVRGQATLSVSRRSGAPVLPALSATIDAQGRFEFPAVPPGDYVLQAQRQTIRVASVRDGGRVVTETVQAEQSEFASTFVTVTGSDVGPVALRTSSGSTLAGRLVLEGPGASGATAPGAFRLGVATADTDYGPPSQRMTASFDSEGRFETSGLVGPVRFVPASAPDGWWLKSITIDGVNAANDPVTLGSPQQSRRNVEVVFSNAVTGISGRVLDSRRQPALGSAVVVFPVEWTRWFEGSRQMKVGSTSNGQFTVSALPPGDYYVAAVESRESLPATWQSADVLNALIPQAQLVTVREGQGASAEVTVARLR